MVVRGRWFAVDPYLGSLEYPGKSRAVPLLGGIEYFAYRGSREMSPAGSGRHPGRREKEKNHLRAGRARRFTGPLQPGPGPGPFAASRRGSVAGTRVHAYPSSRLRAYRVGSDRQMNCPPEPLSSSAAGTLRPVTELIILRHAESTWNSEGRWQGHADPPLSELGAGEADSAGRRLRAGPSIDLLVTSDLRRARTTGLLLTGQTTVTSVLRCAFGFGPADGSALAGRISGNGHYPTPPVPSLVDSQLREIDVGEWSGLTRAEIEARWPGALERHATGQLDRAPGGESRAELDARVGQAARSLVALAASRGAARVLVVAHGGVVKSLARAAGLEEPRVGHLSGYRAVAVAGRLRLECPVDLLLDQGSTAGP